MQEAVRAELQRLHDAPHLWDLQRVTVVVTTHHVHDWQPPFHVPPLHRAQVGRCGIRTQDSSSRRMG
jgi:hypothetical protein